MFKSIRFILERTSKGPFTRTVFVPVTVKLTLMDRMDSKPNLSVKQSLTTGIMINFDGDSDRAGDGGGTSNGPFTCTVSVPVSVTVKVCHHANSEGLFDRQIGFKTHSACQCKFDGDYDGDMDGDGTCKWTLRADLH